jgi:predicted Zn-ribbon and HTH transcriptional regulator
MLVVPERVSDASPADGGSALVAGKAPLRCGECGYEIGSYRVLPPCPMCRELSWEPAPWRPFTRPRV